MKTVLFAAAGSLFLAFAAHAADAPKAPIMPPPAATQALPRVNAAGASCIDGASVTPTAYRMDAEADTSPCSQYLSTQTLVKSPPLGRT